MAFLYTFTVSIYYSFSQIDSPPPRFFAPQQSRTHARRRRKSGLTRYRRVVAKRRGIQLDTLVYIACLLASEKEQRASVARYSRNPREVTRALARARPIQFQLTAAARSRSLWPTCYRKKFHSLPPHSRVSPTLQHREKRPRLPLRPRRRRGLTITPTTCPFSYRTPALVRSAAAARRRLCPFFPTRRLSVLSACFTTSIPCDFSPFDLSRDRLPRRRSLPNATVEKLGEIYRFFAFRLCRVTTRRNDMTSRIQTLLSVSVDIRDILEACGDPLPGPIYQFHLRVHQHCTRAKTRVTFLIAESNSSLDTGHIDRYYQSALIYLILIN